MKYYLICILSFLFLDSTGQVVSDKIITIEPYLSFQNYEHFKRLILNSEDSKVEFISGFDFDWGYTYKLKVKQTELSETLSDGTQYEYALIKIISKEKVPDSTQFSLYLDPNKYYYDIGSNENNETLTQINDSTYLYFDTIEIVVPSQLKSPFDKMLSGEHSALGYFTFLDANSIRLIKL